MSCFEGVGETGEGHCPNPARYEIKFFHDTFVQSLCAEHATFARQQWHEDIEWIRSERAPAWTNDQQLDANDSKRTQTEPKGADTERETTCQDR